MWNTLSLTGTCAAVTYNISLNACYWKSTIWSEPLDPDFASARFIYYGYPVVTDNRNLQTATSSSSFVEIIPTPQYYRYPTITYSSTSLSTASPESSVSAPALGMSLNYSTTSLSQYYAATTSLLWPAASSTSTLFSSAASSQSVSPVSSMLTNGSTSYFWTSASTLSPATTETTTSLEPEPSTSSSANSQATLLSPPSNIDNFVYVGCEGRLVLHASPQTIPGFQIAESSDLMTIERCLSDCFNHTFAGIYNMYEPSSFLAPV